MNVSKQACNSKGFTLIELLVVVLIIGILASIAIPQYFKVVEKGKLVEAQSFIANMKSAQERYYNQRGSYLTTATDLSGLDIEFQGTQPKYGMRNYELKTLADSTKCSGDSEGIVITLARTSTPSKAPKRYSPLTYAVEYDSCVGEFDYPDCANCRKDFK